MTYLPEKCDLHFCTKKGLSLYFEVQRKPLYNFLFCFRVGYLALVRLAKLALYTLGHLFEILAPDGTDATLDKEFRLVITYNE